MYGRTAVGSFFILSHAPPPSMRWQLKRLRSLHYEAAQASLPAHLLKQVELTPRAFHAFVGMRSMGLREPSGS